MLLISPGHFGLGFKPLNQRDGRPALLALRFFKSLGRSALIFIAKQKKNI
jgi:hypothetical protein